MPKSGATRPIRPDFMREIVACEPMVLGILRKRCGWNQQAAEELTREVMASALRRTDEDWENTDSIHAYLSACAHNQWKKWVGKDIRARQLDSDPRLLQSIPDEQAAARFEEAERELDAAALYRLFHLLKPMDQRVLLLIRSEKSYGEIAQEVGLPSADAARKRCERALAELAHRARMSRRPS